MPITYPSFFEALLQRDRALRAGVDSMVDAFDGWLSSSRLPFFTDYTDHGIQHLNCVLATADNLITNSSRDLFTPSDAAVLIAAILLHDSAMHLSEAGFYALIKGDASNWANGHFSDRPWPVLWDEFLFSAKRWDDRRVEDVLGQTSAGEPRAHVRDPFENFDNLTDTDRKLVGEFIRRYHTRMAHEFSTYGLPGEATITLMSVLREDLRDIAGLVARSHGLPVRACLDYLEKRYHRREYDGVHAVYLMTLLRVSDYLQIQAERAPAVVFKYRHIPSKVSQLEWRAHNAISNITQTHDDPESLEIQAQPRDVHTFLRLKDWLSGIQEELDASWAVLGETYGSHPRLSKLGLILRRVRSNLDHVDVFAGQVTYVPARIELTVARPDLLKLLVGPLYDHVPSIGIRELVQNAVDAVREREILQRVHPELRDVGLLSQKNDVEIWLDAPDEDGHAWVTVSDRGAGMSAEIIRDYFLTAGASLRNSDAWKREFEVDDTPHSRVLRSGRFGVGVLAGFLLGPRIEVATRHIRSEVGFRFATTLDTNPIQLTVDPTLEVGTVVRVRVSPAVYQHLREAPARVSVPEHYDWFVYDRPSVARFEGQERRELQRGSAIPPPEVAEPSSFRRLRGVHDYAVYWTYRQLPYLSVNGLFVTNASARGVFSRQRSRWAKYPVGNGDLPVSLSHPNICVDDPDALFPLNLRRTGITERCYPFEEDLIADIVDDWLAYLLVATPNAFCAPGWPSIRQHPGLAVDASMSSGTFQAHWHPFPLVPEGITLFSQRLQSTIEKRAVYVVDRTAPTGIVGNGRIRGGLFVISEGFSGGKWPFGVLPSDLKFLGILELARALRPVPADACKWLVGNAEVRGVRLLVPTRIARKLSKPARWIAEGKRDLERLKKNRSSFGVSSMKEIEGVIGEVCTDLRIEGTVGDYSYVASPGCPDTRLQGESVGKVTEEFFVLEVFLTPAASRSVPEEANPVTLRWERIFGQPSIPFDPTARRRKLRDAYEALEYFIACHEAMRRERVLF